ncbi:heavy metal resistance protein [Cupriavidus sp. USMAHM13]|uniref:CzcE family metal-binding protein n=1 Tax=Cupriavidus sp. USMAHM13 TaxID=1389192 RepID=UPI0008A67064|nr:CzcE family metal-binding protein [Cupriavidus sp. USMAHM13]AOZ00948.1 heavy metal resistance protein [Cupriavidus sp. USMAHM13]
MKTQTSLLAALLLLGAASAWSTPAAAIPAPSAPPSADSRLFGSPARLDTVTRTIDVTPGTSRVLVGSGESVAIRAGGQTVGWTFLQAIGGSSMKLALLMPGVPQAKDVYIQIAPSEIYSGG